MTCIHSGEGFVLYSNMVAVGSQNQVRNLRFHRAMTPHGKTGIFMFAYIGHEHISLKCTLAGAKSNQAVKHTPLWVQMNLHWSSIGIKDGRFQGTVGHDSKNKVYASKSRGILLRLPGSQGWDDGMEFCRIPSTR